MKRIPTILLSLLLALGLLAACGTQGSTAPESEALVPESAPAPAPESETGAEEETPPPGVEIQEPVPIEGEVYRGEVTAILEDGGVEVSQVYGYNYGQARIVFHIDENTVYEDGGFTLAEGAFVQVYYSGMLTRSDPPQATADFFTILASFSDGVVLNGVITEATQTDGGYSLALRRLQTPVAIVEEAEEGDILPEVSADDSDIVIVQVDYAALENITADELVAGTEVSVVTYGIMAMSMPPQVSAQALMPFSP